MTTEVAKTDTGWRVWGHDHAVRELQSAVVRGARHAYILSGYHHVGKTALAIEFARALLCEHPPGGGQSCGTCSTCRRIARGTHPDVSTYDLAGQQLGGEKTSTGKNLSLTIQTVREITSAVALRPMEARQRIIIVDDVETMQETAQEAFLKTLEEPPPYAVVLLLTTDAEILLETIRSRAVAIQLQTVPSATIVRMLRSVGVDGDRARSIAVASVGRPGWALRALDDEQMLTRRVELHDSVVSWIHSDPYGRLAEATRLGDAFGRDRDEVYARLLVAQTVWRSLVLHAAGLPDADHPEIGAGGTATFSAYDAVRALKSVDACLSDLDANVRPRLALQSMVLLWPTG